MLHGNHEDRIDRFVDENPELDGTLKISDLNFKQYGWQEVPYKQNKDDLTINSIAEFDDEDNVIDFLEFLKLKRDKELN